MAVLTSDDGRVKMTLTEGDTRVSANVLTSDNPSGIITNGSQIYDIGSTISVNANDITVQELFSELERKINYGS